MRAYIYAWMDIHVSYSYPASMYKNIATVIYIAMAKVIVIAVVFTVAILDILQACRLIEIHTCS